MIPEGSSDRQEEDDGNPCGHGAESAACAPCPRAGGTGVRWQSTPPVWTPSSPHGSMTKHLLYGKLVYGLQNTQGQRNMLHPLQARSQRNPEPRAFYWRNGPVSPASQGKGGGGQGGEGKPSGQEPSEPRQAMDLVFKETI